MLCRIGSSCAFRSAARRRGPRRPRSGLRRGIIYEQSPPLNAVFIFHDMPHTIRGVFFFHAGLSDAIKLTYNRTDIDAYRAGDKQLESINKNRPIINIEWNNVNSDP